MVSEEPDSSAFQNWAAFDWVSLASSKDPNGVFEMSNTARRMMMERNTASSEHIMRSYHEALDAAAAADVIAASRAGRRGVAEGASGRVSL